MPAALAKVQVSVPGRVSGTHTLAIVVAGGIVLLIRHGIGATDNKATQSTTAQTSSISTTSSTPRAVLIRPGFDGGSFGLVSHAAVG
jgi:hypothetical protein